MASNNFEFELAFSGKALFGDNLPIEKIIEWYEMEKEGYANLGAKDRSNYEYPYHLWNQQMGFRFVNKSSIDEALGFGSAYGDEFLPIIAKVKNITIIEPSEALSKNSKIEGVPVKYVKPQPSGDISIDDEIFDLITCFGVLHHIPNVSHVIRELRRVSKPGGVILIREPIVSMGDWRKPRKGLTKNERGIPLSIFRDIFKDNGLKIKRETLCGFRAVPIICSKLNIRAYNNSVISKLDVILSSLFSWNYSYHADSLFKKIRPTSVFYVLEKV